MKLPPKERLNTVLLGEAGQDVLFRKCAEATTWPTQLADKLGLPTSEVEAMLFELRIALALLAAGAKRDEAFLPWELPTELPPQLAQLWQAMYDQTPKIYWKFVGTANVRPQFLVKDAVGLFQRLTPTKAETLRSLAKEIGLPVNPKYWEFDEEKK